MVGVQSSQCGLGFLTHWVTCRAPGLRRLPPPRRSSHSDPGGVLALAALKHHPAQTETRSFTIGRAAGEPPPTCVPTYRNPTMSLSASNPQRLLHRRIISRRPGLPHRAEPLGVRRQHDVLRRRRRRDKLFNLRNLCPRCTVAATTTITGARIALSRSRCNTSAGASGCARRRHPPSARRTVPASPPAPRRTATAAAAHDPAPAARSGTSRPTPPDPAPAMPASTPTRAPTSSSSASISNPPINPQCVIGPSAFFHASIPPWMWHAEPRPASCAACTAIAERSPNAQ